MAITIDFVIVVVGASIGRQVANWNDERKEFAVEELYLERLSNDLESSISDFEAALDFADESRVTLQTFIKLLHSPTIPDEDLLRAAEEHFTKGVFLASFDPTTTTFDDLRSTGNLRVLRNAELRDTLVELYAEFDNGKNSFRTNLERLSGGQRRNDLASPYSTCGGLTRKWPLFAADSIGERNT